jgi:hypothetical protein
MCRAYTVDEVREQFLDYVRVMIDWWLYESRAPTTREKLEGLAHSILVTLDGGSVALPGFTVIPCPAPEDKQYHIDNDENWYESGDDNDIAGGLHELLFKRD